MFSGRIVFAADGRRPDISFPELVSDSKRDSVKKSPKIETRQLKVENLNPDPPKKDPPKKEAS